MSEQPKIQPELITGTPEFTDSPDVNEPPKFEYPSQITTTTTSESGPTNKPNEPHESFLSGPRQTGSVPLPGGNVAVHEVTGDGMKQTRIVGGSRAPRGYKSAAEAHVAAGVAQPYEVEAVLGRSQEQKMRKRGRVAISKLLGRKN